MICRSASLMVLLLTATVVFAATPEQLILNDPYYKNCFSRTDSNNIIWIHSGPQCTSDKITARFSTDRIDDDKPYNVYMEQGQVPDATAKIQYKFGDCKKIQIVVEKDANGNAVYKLEGPIPDSPTPGSGTDMYGKCEGACKSTNLGSKFSLYFKRLSDFEVRDEKNNVQFNQGCSFISMENGNTGLYNRFVVDQEVVQGVPDIKLKLADKNPRINNFGPVSLLAVFRTPRPTTTPPPTTPTTTTTSTTTTPPLTTPPITTTSKPITTPTADPCDEVTEEVYFCDADGYVK